MFTLSMFLNTKKKPKKKLLYFVIHLTWNKYIIRKRIVGVIYHSINSCFVGRPYCFISSYNLQKNFFLGNFLIRCRKTFFYAQIFMKYFENGCLGYDFFCQNLLVWLRALNFQRLSTFGHLVLSSYPTNPELLSLKFNLKTRWYFIFIHCNQLIIDSFGPHFGHKKKRQFFIF